RLRRVRRRGRWDSIAAPSSPASARTSSSSTRTRSRTCATCAASRRSGRPAREWARAVRRSGAARDRRLVTPRVRRAAAAALVLAAAVVLFAVSRGRWSDPLIDSGREWIVPDALASGGLLYRDVVYWFGPFTPYFQAAFLRVLGSGMGPL